MIDGNSTPLGLLLRSHPLFLISPLPPPPANPSRVLAAGLSTPFPTLDTDTLPPLPSPSRVLAAALSTPFPAGRLLRSMVLTDHDDEVLYVDAIVATEKGATQKKTGGWWGGGLWVSGVKRLRCVRGGGRGGGGLSRPRSDMATTGEACLSSHPPPGILLR